MALSPARRMLTVIGISMGVTLAGLGSIELLFDRMLEDLHSRARSADPQRLSSWQAETDRLTLSERQAERDRLQRQHSEMIAAMGGPVAAAAKDPLTDIAGMIRIVAGQCSGEPRSATVTVDRFTEFTLKIDLNVADAARSRAAIARCVLQQVFPYVYHLQFVRGGSVIAELDRQAIESVPDWASADLGTIDTLLAALSGGPEGQVKTAPLLDPVEDRNRTRREQLASEAGRNFGSTYSNSVAMVQQAVRLQNGATALLGVRNLADMNAKFDQLRMGEQYLATARQFFNHPREEYRRALLQTGLDALFVEATVRGNSMDTSLEAPLMLGIIERAQARSQSATRLIQVMSQGLGNWSSDASTGQIQFDSSTLAAEYRELAQEIEQATRELEAAMSRFSRAMKR